MKSIAELKEPSILSDQQPEGDDSKAAAGYYGSKENELEEEEDYD